MTEKWDFWTVAITGGIIGGLVGAIAEATLGSISAHLLERHRARQEKREEVIDLARNWDAKTAPDRFRYAELKGADLRGVSLPKANLSYADLRNARLSNADLQGTVLQGANLCQSELDGADLSHANLEEAKLWQVNLTRTHLHYAFLKQAKLDATTKIEMKWRQVWRILLRRHRTGQKCSRARPYSCSWSGSMPE